MPYRIRIHEEDNGRNEGRRMDASLCSYSIRGRDWIKSGYALTLNKSGNSARDFWVWKPRESASNHLSDTPDFWSRADEMVIPLLQMESRPESHGIRHYSPKVTTISALSTEVIEGNMNIPQLSIRCNYGAFAAREVAKIYSTNADRRTYVLL